MAMRKLCKLDESSAGVRLPVDELRRLGVVSSDPGEPIELDGEPRVHVHRDGDGEWRIELIRRPAPASD